MKTSTRVLLALLGLAFAAACADDAPRDDARSESTAPGVGVAVPRESFADSGVLEGRVRLEGRAPGNRVIRMGSDPACESATGGEMVVDNRVVVNDDSGVANVFVYLDGDLPRFEPSPEPVHITQVDCLYEPRVVGVEVGQLVEISNGDAVVHNVHARSNRDNGFNIGQPFEGMVYSFTPRAPEVMLHLSCDLHRWMNAYLGIVAHSYFAVTGGDGSFSVPNIPPGTYTLHAWHEELGTTSRPVEIGPNQTVREELAFSAP